MKMGYIYKRNPGIMEIYLNGFMAFALNSNANDLRQRISEIPDFYHVI